MKPLIKKKDLIVALLSLAVLSSISVSCSLAPVKETAKPSPTEQSANLENRNGVSVAAKSLCSDGVKTALILQTDLDPDFWQLREDDFYPKGKTYLETSIIFLENNELYSTSSSGKRDSPVFDSQNHRVSTVQAFFFPRTPTPNSEFTVRARVYLRELPPAYAPPAGVNFVEPGAIEVPAEYDISPSLSECP